MVKTGLNGADPNSSGSPVPAFGITIYPAFVTCKSTATPFVTPTFQSVTKATTGGTPVNYNITDQDPITTNVRAWLMGRRPTSGMMYPRGIYNK